MKNSPPPIGYIFKSVSHLPEKLQTKVFYCVMTIDGAYLDYKFKVSEKVYKGSMSTVGLKIGVSTELTITSFPKHIVLVEEIPEENNAIDKFLLREGEIDFIDPFLFLEKKEIEKKEEKILINNTNTIFSTENKKPKSLKREREENNNNFESSNKWKPESKEEEEKLKKDFEKIKNSLYKKFKV